MAFQVQIVADECRTSSEAESGTGYRRGALTCPPLDLHLGLLLWKGHLIVSAWCLLACAGFHALLRRREVGRDGCLARATAELESSMIRKRVATQSHTRNRGVIRDMRGVVGHARPNVLVIP